MRLTLRSGASVPFFMEDCLLWKDLTASDLSPIATYNASAKAASDLSTLNKQIEVGFVVQNVTETSNYIYAITWSQYQDYLKTAKSDPYTITSIVPRKIWIPAGDFCYTPIIKAFATTDGTYPSVVTTLNQYRIL